ncbi:hypothetical protein ATR01nite_29270 [Acetobacter tropicalis]|uniref:Uncharacterized protein n=1 Tax=Acetobacter tropicalis TaxID=104102 RepID=A0A511FSB4_9PROT|nr:hypothetical protein ATR01nite_29270 [Acetobacter tropicalis]
MRPLAASRSNDETTINPGSVGIVVLASIAFVGQRVSCSISRSGNGTSAGATRYGLNGQVEDRHGIGSLTQWGCKGFAPVARKLAEFA